MKDSGDPVGNSCHCGLMCSLLPLWTVEKKSKAKHFSINLVSFGHFL